MKEIIKLLNETVYPEVDHLLQEGVIITYEEKQRAIESCEQIIHLINQMNFQDLKGKTHMGLDKTTVDLVDLFQKINAFRLTSLPCNPIPFAKGLIDGVRMNGSEFIQSDNAKALLFVLITQCFGTKASIDMLALFNYLDKNIPE